MKRPSAINTRVHEDSSELLTNTAPSSSQTYIDEPVSPSNNNGNNSDSDTISESSRLRKKRNTYQKISDDIRVNLLESVQNGETLKAAAKRHKINYSSAKSILHTYRKEGRILKKSAQERTMKRKGESSPEYSEDPKPVKQCKKENMQPTSTDSKTSKPVNMLAADKKKPLAQSASHAQNENSTSVTNKSSSKKMQEEKPNKAATETVKPQATQQEAKQKDEEPVTTKTVPERDHSDQIEVNNMGNSDNTAHQTIATRSRRFDSFHAYMGAHLSEAGDSHDHHHQHHSLFSDPFSDMMHTLHNRAHPHDDIYHGNSGAYFFPHGFGPSGALEDKTSKVENGKGWEDFHFGGLADCPLKSFMDTQNLFREALRKASFFSQGGNQPGSRKDSIDFFKM